MLFQINTMRVYFTTILVVCCLAADNAWASYQDDAGLLPDAVDSVAAYMTLRDWLDTFDPPSVNSPQAKVKLDKASAICMILRIRGRIAGEAIERSVDELMLRRCAGRAMSMLLGDAAVRSLPEELRNAVGKNTTLELEIAGELVPVVGGSWQEAVARIRPGIDGVAMRANDKWTFLFPAQIRQRNLADNLANTLRFAVTELGLIAEELNKLRRVDGLSIYRFKTRHFTQNSPNNAPMSTFRGKQLVSADSVNSNSINEFAVGIAKHLLGRSWRVGNNKANVRPLGMRGTYLPSTDNYQQLVASPFEQALVSYSLSRFANCSGISDPQQGLAATHAVSLIDDLAKQVRGVELNPVDDPVACAMIVLAVMEIKTGVVLLPETVSLIEQAREVVLNTFDIRTKSFISHFVGGKPTLPLSGGEKALICASMSSLMLMEPAAISKDLIRTALDEVWASVLNHEKVTLLPWIGIAENQYSLVEEPDETASNQLKLLRKLLHRSQISRKNTHSEPDLQGGYSLNFRTGMQTTAMGLRPAFWLASTLNMPQVVSNKELASETGGLLSFMRFLMQLRITEYDKWAFSTPERAIGGIREAPWDNTMTVPAQALALLTTCELKNGIKRLDELN